MIAADDGRLWAIDHGIAFHDEPKLRTVVWDYATEAIPATALVDLQVLQQTLLNEENSLSSQLQALLNGQEMSALQSRLADLIAHETFPEPGPGRPYPWPLV